MPIGSVQSGSEPRLNPVNSQGQINGIDQQAEGPAQRGSTKNVSSNLFGKLEQAQEPKVSLEKVDSVELNSVRSKVQDLETNSPVIQKETSNNFQKQTEQRVILQENPVDKGFAPVKSEVEKTAGPSNERVQEKQISQIEKTSSQAAQAPPTASAAGSTISQENQLGASLDVVA